MPYVIGIAGGSASGKSTFAKALVDRLHAAAPNRSVGIIHTDHYARVDHPDAPTFTSASTGETMFDWNHPETIDNARVAEDVAAHSADIIIVEGLMVLHVDKIRELLDLRLYVDLDDDVRALRRMLRNTHDRGHDPGFVDTYYRESARVGHARYVEPSRMHADLIVRGDADFERIAGLIGTIVVANL